MNAIDYYVNLFPQLTLGVGSGIKDSEEYKDIVLRGEKPSVLKLPFNTNNLEERIEVETPIGKTEVLYLPQRNIFEYFVRVLAYKNEEVDIPRTTGAIMISGLNCWQKIEDHKTEFLKNHDESEWDEEFDKFTSVKENYKASVLLISKGNYSAIPCEKVNLEQDLWFELSKKIRIYHENTHLISRKLYPDHKEAIRDEVIADSIGIYGALGYYDANMERIVLGINEEEYIKGSRLENYVEESELGKAVIYAKELIDKLEEFYKNNSGEPFEMLLKIEESYIR